MMYDFSKVSVLIVEDSLPMAHLSESILRTLGFKNVCRTYSGRKGFSEFCSLNPDIVLTDWDMEDIDGLELTRLIRKNVQSPDPFTPIIMMTGYTEINRVKQARDYGVTEFLAKPFSVNDLAKRLEHLIEKPRQFVHSQKYFGPDRRRKRSNPTEINFSQRRIDDPQIHVIPAQTLSRHEVLA